MIAAVNDYIKDENRIYAVGVSLYERYGDSTTFLNIFRAGENSYSKSKLYQELNKINDSSTGPFVSSRTVQVSDEFKNDHETQSQAVNVNLLTPRLKELWAYRLAMFKEQSHIHTLMCALLKTTEFNAQRKEYAERIDKLSDDIELIWEEVQDFLKTGREKPEHERLTILLLEKKPEKKKTNDYSGMDKYQLSKKLQTLKTSRDRAKREGNKGNEKHYDNQISIVTDLMNQ